MPLPGMMNMMDMPPHMMMQHNLSAMHVPGMIQGWDHLRAMQGPSQILCNKCCYVLPPVAFPSR